LARYQMNAQVVHLEHRIEKLHAKLESYKPRECSDWLTQWSAYDHATRQTAMKLQARRHHPPEVRARLPYLTPGRVVAFPRFRGIVLRRYRSRGQRHEMVTVLRTGGVVAESQVADIMGVIDRNFYFTTAPAIHWATLVAL